MRIVFVGVSDPIGPGFVKSFDHPGGNITGFTMGFEETMGGKWLELLREMAPSVRRASMLFNPETANAGANGGLYLKSIETAARNTGTELIVSAVHDPAGVDEVFAAMAQGSSGGVLVMPNAFMWQQRERIVAQAEDTASQRSIHWLNSSWPGGCCPMGLISWIRSGAPHPTLIAS
jgi:putative ABC transport system substrate-binding protein